MHKRIGILGGMSPESTTVYYEHITRTYAARYGDYAYPEILLYSVNFQQFVEWQHHGDWSRAAAAMAAALERLRIAGADFGLIATNTMHIVFDEVQSAVGMPLLSIMDATAQAIREARMGVVGLLGTVFTMREPFFRQGLNRFGVEVLVPSDCEQERLNGIIYNQLCRGDIRAESRSELLETIEKLRARGAEGVVLGCTEIPLLVRSGDCSLPLFNTTVLHAERALNYAVAPPGA